VGPIVRVLIVDDHAPFRRAAARLVAEADARILVEGAASGEEALAAASTRVPDLVLMDVHLPGMSGMDATRRLRAAHPGLRVLLISSYDAADLAVEAAECGAVGYVDKASLDGETVRRALQAGPP
jgi:DNA-binding NarL/FixJ family response regulator